jgi:N-acetylmuramoyl-L-alanine amidase
MRGLYYFLFLSILISCKGPNEPDALLNNEKDRTAKRTRPVLILDAGHGAIDPGAVNDSLNLYEKDITRSITDAIMEKIDTNKIQVIETRPGDTNIHRHERIKKANLYQPDLLLTIHINNDPNNTYNGFEMSYSDSLVVHMDHKDTISILNPNREKAAEYIKTFVPKIAKKFPVMRNRYYHGRKDRIWMICAGRYPSLLLEFGFINNSKDLAYLTNKKAISKLADSITESLYEVLLADKKTQL